MKHQLKEVSETALITLWSRAVEQKEKPPILIDKVAVCMVEQIDYDFSKLDSAWKSQVGVCIRAKLIDEQVSVFIEKNSDAVVVSLGAGLDSRFLRVDNGKVRWYDVDLAPVIEMKQKFIQPEDRYTMLSCSMFETEWLERVLSHQAPTFIIMEGVLMYFDSEDVSDLLVGIVETLVGATIVFDSIHPYLVSHSDKHDSVKHMNAPFKWGIKDASEITAIDSRLQVMEVKSLFDFYPKRWRWVWYVTRISVLKRLMCGCIYTTLCQKS
ncbi:MAG: class I SAM-dependent methyltransferase [Epsilonproteobacteria bacterium]|nr:class I SAM-dependent methyltransferase [Campylobacterota bacterium]